MLPRPKPQDQWKKIKTNYNRKVDYDLPQLDLQWYPILQEIRNSTPLKGPPTPIKDGVEPRFQTSNDLEGGNSIIRNYKQRRQLQPEVQPLCVPSNDVDSPEESDVDSPRVLRQMSSVDTIDGRGTINAKQLKQHLVGMDRKTLGRVYFC